MSKISIIVPVYNVEQYLARCVESLIAQTYKNVEIVLVDDGSTDSSGDIANELSKKDNRIIVYHKENGGLSDARNYGLKVATGEYILYVDSDDYIETDACQKLEEKMRSDVDFVIGAYREISHDGIIEKRHSNIVAGEKYEAREFVILSIKQNEWYAPAWLNLYKRDFLLKNNLFFKKGRLFEDHQMLPKLFLAADAVIYVDHPFYNYIIRNNSIMTSGNRKEKIEMSFSNYNEWMDLFQKVQDKKYQRYLYGVLVKYYLASCRTLHISGWNVKDMHFKFALKYAIGMKDKLKVIFFAIFPQLYIRII